MTVLDRAERAKSPLASWRPASLWRLCSAAGVRLTPHPSGMLGVSGPREAVARLAGALAFRKVALMRGACSLCDDELATEICGRCRWCAPISEKALIIEPCGERERLVLAAHNYEHRHRTQ
jgi:hypothetical protein